MLYCIFICSFAALLCRSQSAILPVLKLYTNKTAGDIHFNCWGSNEEVAVAHSFSTDIPVYDLRAVSAVATLAARQFINGQINGGLSGETTASTWDSNNDTAVGGTSTSNPRHTRPMHVLSMPNGKRSGGHNCLLSVELEVQLPPMRGCDGAPVKRPAQTRKCILAGSSTGHLRMWYVDGAVGTMSLLRQSSSPAPTKPVAPAVPVTAVTKAGTKVVKTQTVKTSNGSNYKRPFIEEEDELDQISSFSFKPKPTAFGAGAGAGAPPMAPGLVAVPPMRPEGGNTAPRGSTSSSTPLFPKWEVCANPLIALAGSTQVLSPPVVSLQRTAFCNVADSDGMPGSAPVTWNKLCANDLRLGGNPTVVSSFNSVGLVCMWDIGRLQSTSFGATQVPTWIACVNLWDFPLSDTSRRSSYSQPCTVYEAFSTSSCNATLPPPLTLKQYIRQQVGEMPGNLSVVGVSKAGTVNSLLGERAASGLLLYYVTFSDSTTALVDLNLRAVLQCTVSASAFGQSGSKAAPPVDEALGAAAAGTATPEVIYGAGILRSGDDYTGVGALSVRSGCKVPCAMLPATSPDSSVVCVQRNEHSVDIVAMAAANAYTFSPHLPHSSLGPVSGCLTGSAISNCPAEYMVKAPAVVHRRTDATLLSKSFNYILPGCVASIDQHNAFDIFTSVDLRSFLCAQSVQSSEPTKSCQIRLEIEPNGIESYLDFGSLSLHSTQTRSAVYPLPGAGSEYFTVVSVTANRVTVNMPVECEVTQCFPRVVLRTNLTSHCPGSADSSKSSKSGSVSASLFNRSSSNMKDNRPLSPDDLLTVPRVLKTFTSSCPISYVAAHPAIPVVCVGMQDDTVQFIVSDNAPV
jgi:hypothetical protein